jgi:hypothetical protein
VLLTIGFLAQSATLPVALMMAPKVGFSVVVIMNALLYLGVPMMAKFSPELNMVRSDAYTQIYSMAKKSCQVRQG